MSATQFCQPNTIQHVYPTTTGNFVKVLDLQNDLLYNSMQRQLSPSSLPNIKSFKNSKPKNSTNCTVAIYRCFSKAENNNETLQFYLTYIEFICTQNAGYVQN